MKTFTVEITSIRYKSPDRTFYIAGAEATPEQPPHVSPKDFLGDTVKGELGTALRVGDVLDVTGDFKRHPRHGPQFEVSHCVRSVASNDRAIVAFLKGFPQIGPMRARAIVDHFGGHEAAIAVMTDSHLRLTEIKGISPERAREIHVAFTEASGRRSAALFLGGISSMTERLALRIMDKWGDKVREVISADPYVLMELRGVGFRKADAVAGDLGIVGDDPRRCAAAALFVLEAAATEGHVYSTLDDLIGSGAGRPVKAALAEVSIDSQLIVRGLETLAARREVGGYMREAQVVIDGDRYYPAELFHAERGIAEHITRIVA